MKKIFKYIHIRMHGECRFSTKKWAKRWHSENNVQFYIQILFICLVKPTITHGDMRVNYYKLTLGTQEWVWMLSVISNSCSNDPRLLVTLAQGIPGSLVSQSKCLSAVTLNVHKGQIIPKRSKVPTPPPLPLRLCPANSPRQCVCWASHIILSV